MSSRKIAPGSRAATAAIALLLGGALSARADERLTAPAAGEALAPGAIVEVRWKPLCRQTVREIDEAEIVLSLDGGRTFPVRVSPELEPCATKYLWKVPALPAAHARLALRAGIDERDGSERLEILSADFRILAEPDGRIEQLWRHMAEWRLAPEPAALTAEDLLERRLGAPPAVSSASTERPPAAVASSASGLERPRRFTIEVSAGVLTPVSLPSPGARRASAPTPLRL